MTWALLFVLAASAEATLDVRNYGAVPNDNVDDGAAFIKAIAAAPNSKPRRARERAVSVPAHVGR